MKNVSIPTLILGIVLILPAFFFLHASHELSKNFIDPLKNFYVYIVMGLLCNLFAGVSLCLLLMKLKNEHNSKK